MVNSVSSTSGSSSNDALTSTTKTALERANLNTKAITTETEGRSALAAAKRKAEAKHSQEAQTPQKTSVTNDEAFKVETSQTEASETASSKK